jgi:hypothetical protein
MRAFCVILALACLSSVVSAGSITSYVGTLANPEDTVQLTIALASAGSLTLQTYGFGGGTNAAGTVIPNGGVDLLIALFFGTGPGALFIDGTSDALTNYSSHVGCPPAGLVTIGSYSGQCGDVTMDFPALGAGTYTVLLSSATYIPNAVFEAPPAYLGDGFTDLTGGVFQTCVDEANCKPDTANWALDITSSTPAAVPEPASLGLAGLGLAITAFIARLRPNRIGRMQK